MNRKVIILIAGCALAVGQTPRPAPAPPTRMSLAKVSRTVLPAYLQVAEGEPSSAILRASTGWFQPLLPAGSRPASANWSAMKVPGWKRQPAGCANRTSARTCPSVF